MKCRESPSTPLRRLSCKDQKHELALEECMSLKLCFLEGVKTGRIVFDMLYKNNPRRSECSVRTMPQGLVKDEPAIAQKLPVSLQLGVILRPLLAQVARICQHIPIGSARLQDVQELRALCLWRAPRVHNVALAGICWQKHRC